MNDTVISDLFSVVEARKNAPTEGSYTSYLFEKGLDKILKKCAEECGELIIAAKNDDKKEIVNEWSDLMYHMLVLLSEKNIPLSDVWKELSERAQKQQNLKVLKVTDKNT